MSGVRPATICNLQPRVTCNHLLYSYFLLPNATKGDEVRWHHQHWHTARVRGRPRRLDLGQRAAMVRPEPEQLSTREHGPYCYPLTLYRLMCSF